MAVLANIESIGTAEDACIAPAHEHAFTWSCEFANLAHEAEFREATWDERVERMKGIHLAVLIFAGWAFVDYLVIGFTWPFVLILMLRIATIFLARIPVMYFAGVHSHRGFFISVACVQAYVFSVFLLSVHAAGLQAGEQALSALTIIFAFYFGVPNRLPLNIAVSLASTVGFALVVSLNADIVMRSATLAFVLLLVGNACGAQAVRVTNRLRRNAFLTLVRQQKLNEQLTVEIASRQEAQRAMHVTEANFLSIFVAAPEALAIIDPSTYAIIQANQRAQDLYGGEYVLNGKDALSMFVDHDVRSRLNDAAVGLRPREPIEARLITGNGEIIWAHISAALVRFHGMPALLVALQDVTARRQEAEALREARDQATESSRSKSQFLANMSHELRTPLNAIIGFSEALERELFGPVGNPRYLEYATDIHDSGVHLLNLINDILDLSKIEAGHFELHEDETDLADVVASACRIVRHRAQEASIKIETNMPTPAIRLCVDERALKQILINLVSNAVKFSNDRGTVRIEVTASSEGIRIAVIDSGIGIAPHDIPKALAPFTQVDGTLSRAHEGTGLGLPLAKHMTELHGGTLTIVSNLGVGTTIFVDLPASRLVDGNADVPFGLYRRADT